MKQRIASGESLQQVAKSLGTNEWNLRKKLKAVSTCKNPILFRRFWEHVKWESQYELVSSVIPFTNLAADHKSTVIIRIFTVKVGHIIVCTKYS
jgi:hypothetical protein